MHELSLATEIVRLLETQRAQRGFQRVNVVRLRAGALAGVEPHALRLGFEIARAGSCAADATLEIDLQPPTLRCTRCNATTESHAGGESCPACGSGELVLEGYDGLDVLSIDVD